MPGRVPITFDDGLASVYRLAFPEMERYGIVGTAFVISDLVFSWIEVLIAALTLSNVASTLYGVRKASERFAARPDLKASARILLAALVAAVPTIALTRLDGAGIGIVNLVLGGLLYLVIYLTVAPVLGAIDRLDIGNLKIILDRIPAASAVAKHVLNYEAWILSVVG